MFTMFFYPKHKRYKVLESFVKLISFCSLLNSLQMTIRLKKNSGDYSSDIEKLYMERSSSYKAAFTKPLVFVAVSFFLSLIIMLQNLTLINQSISPQFTLKIMEGNNESIPILKNVKQSLLMITFLAQDFSFDNYTGLNEINTFEPSSKYELYYNGYKKFNEGSVYFRADKGLDVFGCLVEDMALQLAEISNAESTEKVIDSILVTYSFTIKNLEEMHTKYKKTGEVEGHFDETKLSVGHHAYAVESYGKTMTKFPVTSIFVSLLSCISLLLLVNLMVFRRSVGHRTLITAALIQLPQCIVQFCSWASQIRFYMKIGRPLDHYNVGKLTPASGFYSMQLAMIMSVVTEVLLIYAYYISKKQC